LHHFHAGNAQATTLEAVHNLSYELALHAAGLEEDEGCFHSYFECNL
jgi:hypothetical protein